MSRITRLTRRTLALSAATFLGAVGAVAFAAAPASAHAASLTSTVECVEGKPNTVKVTWKLTHDMNKRADVSNVVLNRVPGGVGQIVDGAQMASKESALVGSKEFATDAGAQTLTATVKWPGTNQVKGVANTARWNKFDCGPEESTAVSDCDGSLIIKIRNVGALPKRYEVEAKGGDVQRKTLATGEEWTVVVPKEQAGAVKVRSKRAGDQANGGWSEKSFAWAKPDACFEATSKSTCEDLVITVKNTGTKAIKATVTVGDKSETTEVQPGKAADVSLDGVDGLVAKLTVDGKTRDFSWAKPADCAGPGLPVTGANAGLLAGAALVLVAGGGGLFFLARRRRIRFAA